MTSAEQNLKVVTDHLITLAGTQQHAADLFVGSNRSTNDIAANAWSTHGAVCAATNIALSTAETARKAAGKILQKKSEDFGEQLKTAATNYADVDYLTGNSLGGACNA